SQQFLGMGGTDRPYSDDTARLIDEEVKGIIGTGYDRAKDLLAQHRQALEDIVIILFEKEVMDGDELRAILERHGIDLPPKKGGDEAEQAPARDSLSDPAVANGNHSVDEPPPEGSGTAAEEMEPPLT
ncbi:MAG: hypothetical protein QGH25_16625, partial [Candidatus Latescibacteria bacterium]|nr:hypothetical protein [Candidatus Latescibacterota bacterium]